MSEQTLGIYLHVPFCRRKCLYCDFCSLAGGGEDLMRRYTDRLCREIVSWRDRARAYAVDTVYFGGGTPTLLPISLFEKIMGTLRDAFRVTSDAEITTECNPATVTAESLRALRALGFNRLSIGVQSRHDNELRALGRIHTWDDCAETVRCAGIAGFDNISADLMFGIPEQTRESFRATLTDVTALGLSHISAYGLKIEEGTPFDRMRDSLPLPDEENERAMYMDAVDFLASRGFARYEISNFARPGRESRHNLKYWNRDPYLGLGPAAHSFFEDCRFYHGRDMEAYLDGTEPDTAELISRDEAAEEYIMLRLRLENGISEREYETKFAIPFEKYATRLSRYLSLGLVRHEGGVWRLTSDGFYLSNAILSDVLDLE